MVYETSVLTEVFLLLNWLITKNRLSPVPGQHSCSLFCLFGSADGAGFCTGAAFNAQFSIDFVFSVTFADRRNGAFGSTGAAADALVRNFVSHDFTSKYIRSPGTLDTMSFYH